MRIPSFLVYSQRKPWETEKSFSAEVYYDSLLLYTERYVETVKLEPLNYPEIGCSNVDFPSRFGRKGSGFCPLPSFSPITFECLQIFDVLSQVPNPVNFTHSGGERAKLRHLE